MSENIFKIRYLKTSWRKASYITDLIRGKKVDKAIGILTFLNKYIALDILKLIKNAVNSLKENPNNLMIKEIFVNKGMMTKRMRPGPQGRAMMFRKKNCSIILKLERV